MITGIMRVVLRWYSAKPGIISTILVYKRVRSGSAATARPGLELFGAGFHRDQRIGQEVVVPIRVGRGAAFGGDDDETIAIADTGDRIDAFLPALCPNGMQEQQRPAGERAADFAGVGPELLDDPQVTFILWITHSNLLL